INGHITINKSKMSKSTGNFMTLNDAITEYGADATRIALANAGSGMDNANFTDENVNEAILKLASEMDYCKKLVDKISGLDINKLDRKTNFWDDVFINSMNICIIDANTSMKKINFQS